MTERYQKKENEKQLTSLSGYGRMEENERWIMCPACGRGKVLKALPTTEAKNLPVYCKRCHQQAIVNISSRA